jgi:hypothetical protein
MQKRHSIGAVWYQPLHFRSWHFGTDITRRAAGDIGLFVHRSGASFPE